MGKTIPHPPKSLEGTPSGPGDPTGSHLSDADWLAWARRAEQTMPLGRLGVYELIAEIGHGAQAAVYRARQPGTRRDVVIKRLAAGTLATPSMRARFEREVEILGTLRHPHIVTVHAAELLDGQPLVVMEWIEGQSIDRWARSAEGANSEIRRILTAFGQVCDAVAHAHQHSVVHRDLKPSNILVDLSGQPRVLDFGLALSLERVGEGSAAGTLLTHSFVGTPAYAAPEQIEGGGRSVDTRSDIFALGVILYELLTGVWPFPTGEAQKPSASLAEVFDAIRSVEPRRPSAQRAEIGTDLDAVLLKALSKNPAERYQSADALAADLRRYLASEPVLAQPITTWVQLRTLARRHRVAFIAAGAIAGLTLLFAVVSTTLALRLAQRQAALVAAEEREREERVAAVAQREIAEGEVAKAQATIRFLETFLFSDHPEVPLRTDVHLRELLDQATKAIDDGHWRDQPDIEAAVRTLIGRAYLGLRLWHRAEVQLRPALATRRALHAEPAAIAENVAWLGRSVHEQLHLDEAETLYREALSIRTALHGPDDMNIIRCEWSLAAVLRDGGHHDEAEALSRHSLEVTMRLLGPDQLDTAESHHRLGWNLDQNGKSEEAETHLRRALEIREAALGSDHVFTAATKLRIGTALVSQQRFAEAEAMIKTAYDVFVAQLGGDHPQTLQCESHLARLYRRTHDYDRAEALFKDVVGKSRRQHGEDSAVVAQQMRFWGVMRRERGDVAGAEELCRAALDESQRMLGLDHHSTHAALVSLADVYIDQKRFAEAERLMTAHWTWSQTARTPPRAMENAARRLAHLYEAWNVAAPSEQFREAAELWTRLADGAREPETHQADPKP